MIIDLVKNLPRYGNVIPHSRPILDFLVKCDLAALSPGKYDIVGEYTFILVQEYTTKNDSEKKWESHRKYMDIQIVVSGLESMCYAPADALTIMEPYNEQNDVEFYIDDSRPHSRLTVSRNQFCLFYPEESHKPGLHVTEESRIKKAVIKVAV